MTGFNLITEFESAA